MTDPADTVQQMLAACDELNKIWGEARLGLVLTEAFYRGEPISTEELADRVEVSTETVRRKLRPLWNVNRVRTIREGRNVSYVATQQWAERTNSVLNRA